MSPQVHMGNLCQIVLTTPPMSQTLSVGCSINETGISQMIISIIIYFGFRVVQMIDDTMVLA